MSSIPTTAERVFDTADPAGPRALARLVFGRGGWIRLGSPTDPPRARATAQRVRQTRPYGCSDWVEVREVTR